MDVNALDKTLVAEAWTTSEAYANLEALVDFGSRFAGTSSEIEARDFIAAKFRAYGLENVHFDPFEYLGWWRGTCALKLERPRTQALDAISLVYSPSTPSGGLSAAVVDVGMGSEDEYAQKGDTLRGKFVLCSSANPEEGRVPHRREKYGWAVNAGAIGFIYARHLPGGLPETGSLRPGRLGEIPAVAVSYETGFALKRLIGKGETVVRVDVQNTAHATTAYHVLGDVPGQTGEVILVGAHYDGHDISQGAMDDGSGACQVMELARLFGPFKGQLRRTVRCMAFACEELGVLGSTEYVKAHRDALGEIALMINLDGAVGGGAKGFGYAGLEEIAEAVKRIARETGYALKVSNQLVTASDNFPFYMEGVPAITMFAKEPDRAVGRGYSHTAMDTLDKVNDRDMRECAMVAARVILRLSQSEALGRRRKPDEVKALLQSQGLEEALRAQDKWPFG